MSLVDKCSSFQQQVNHQRITINVSGNIFETHQNTLERYPETLLGGHNAERERFYCPKTCQYYFNRDRSTFEAILFFYQSSGKLYLPKSTNLEHFVSECEFFKLPEDAIDFLKSLHGAALMLKVREAARSLKYTLADSFLQRARNFLDHPNSSRFAMSYMMFQSFLITISIGRYCMETLESNDYLLPLSALEISHPWVILELLASGFFFLDLSFRFLFSGDKKSFFSSPCNVVDILSVPPYSIVAALIPTEHGNKIRFLKALQFIRIIRFFRFGKLSRRISIVYVIVEDSIRDLQYFFVCLLVIVTTSGSIVYLIERSEDETGFVSIPESMWWSLQAYLTIGYGDVVPSTVLGKIFSGFYMIIGLLTLMLPVLSLILKLVACTEEVNLEEEDEK